MAILREIPVNKTKRFLQTSLIYFLGNILIKCISFFLLPLYTGYLPEADFGYFDTVVALLNMIAPLIALEIWSGILRFALDYKVEQSLEKWSVVRDGLTVAMFSSLIYIVGGVILFFAIDPPYKWLIFLTGLGVIWQNVLSGVARGLERNRLYMSAGVLGSGITLLLNYILIRYLGMGVESLFIATVIGYAVHCGVIIFGSELIHHVRRVHSNSQRIRLLVSFSWPLCINSLSFWLLSGYSKVGVTVVLGLAAAGIFGAASRFASMLSLVTSIFNLSWQELAFASGKGEDRNVTYTRGFSMYSLVLGLAVLILIPITKLVFPFLVKGEDFPKALNLLPIYYFATMLSSLAGFLGSIFGAEHKTRHIFMTTLVGGGINVIILHLLLPVLGLVAAPLGLWIGFLIIIVLRLMWLKKRALITFRWRNALYYLAAFLTVTAIFYYANQWQLIVLTIVISIISLWLLRPLFKQVWQAVGRSKGGK
jgi:O-antigen/teichoic acid export membrane protein